jgi:hypothetical protein
VGTLAVRIVRTATIAWLLAALVLCGTALAAPYGPVEHNPADRLAGDHVHIGLNLDGARERTSLWRR